MNESFVGSNKNNILFLGLLILALSFHLFLGKILLDLMNFQSIIIVLSITIILVGLHFTVGRKFLYAAGVAE